MDNNRVGGTIDSWCGKCKMMLAHTIEAMVEDRPVRVSCNTCRSQHNYKSSEPGKRVARAQTGGGRPTRYKGLMKDNTQGPRDYSPKETYQAGDVVKHPHFGLGVTTAVKDATKIEVLFENGAKVLVHGR